MKGRKNVIGLIIFLISVNIYGQEIKGFRFSANLGITYSNTIGKGTVEDSWINGFPPNCYTNSSASKDFIIGKKFGMGLAKDLNKTFSVGFDIAYEEKGCKIPVTHLSYVIRSNGTYESVTQEIDEKSNIRLKYFILPVKLEARFKMIYVVSGVYTGYLMDADDYGTIKIDDREYKFNRDKDSRYSRIDFGVLLGAGVSVPINEINVIKFGINGNWNVTGNDSRGMTPGYKYHWYNQSFNLEIKFERKI